MLNKILPVEDTLKRRHFKEISQCSACLAMEEDLIHALAPFSHVRRFWNEAQTLFDFHLLRLHPDTWSRDIICDSQFPDGDRAKIVIVMWTI